MATPLPEPPWTMPVQPIEMDPSSLKSTGARPSYISGILLRLLEAHFSDPGNIVDPALKSAIWKPKADPIESKILIEPYHKYEATNIEQRPGIYVSRGSIGVQEFALRDRALTHIKRNSGNFEGTDFYKLLTGMHTVIVCAKTDMATERLGEEIFYMLLEYGPDDREGCLSGACLTSRSCRR